jgi:hypothetical protein
VREKYFFSLRIIKEREQGKKYFFEVLMNKRIRRENERSIKNVLRRKK